jgi:hypothetical protein
MRDRTFFSTRFGTKGEMSPPIPAIWRTSVDEMNCVSGEAVRNTVSTRGFMMRFMPTIWTSYS